MSKKIFFDIYKLLKFEYSNIHWRSREFFHKKNFIPKIFFQNKKK